jgi:hypothetical protein
MVDELHKLTWNRTKKSLAMALSGARGVEGERWLGWSNQCIIQAYLGQSQLAPPAKWIYLNKTISLHCFWVERWTWLGMYFP